MKELYTKAIESINHQIQHDDQSTWWPKIIRIEPGYHEIHDINGIEAGCWCNSSFHPESHSLLRLLVDPSLTSAIFAYPVKLGILQHDVIVGYLDKNKHLTLAWANKRVYPKIGQLTGRKLNIPIGTVWIVAASLTAPYRNAVSLFGQSKTIDELELVTPVYKEQSLISENNDIV